jgi:ribosome-associated protein
MKTTLEDSQKLAERIAELALELKADDVKTLNVSEQTSLTDYFVICSGQTDIQAKAIADHILDELAPDEKPMSKEGLDVREWILLDYVNVVVHVFQKAAHQFYNIEKLWPDAVVKEFKDDEIPSFLD